MKKLVAIGAAAVIAAGVSYADDVAFPNADGSFDLTSPDAWSPLAYPPTGRVKITAGGTYAAGVDGTFAGGMIQATGAATTFDLTRAEAEDGVLTLGATFMPGKNQTVTFKGGTWNFSGKSALNFASGWGASGGDHYTLDGCVFTNAASTTFGYGHSGANVITLKNGAKWYMEGGLAMNLCGFEPATLNVTTGSVVVAKGQFSVSKHNPGQTGRAKQFVYVDGPGAKLTCKNPNSSDAGAILASRGSFSEVGASNGGEIELGGGWGSEMGSNAGANSNVFFAVGAGSRASINALYFNKAGTVGNRIVARDGGTVTTGTIYPGGTNATLVADNGTIEISSWNSGGVQPIMFISGAQPCIRIGTSASTYNPIGAFRISVELPPEGYPAGHVPLCSTGDLAFGQNVIDLVNLAEIRADILAKGEAKRTYRLVQTAKAAYDVNKVAATNNVLYGDAADFTYTDKTLDVTIYGGEPSTLTVVSSIGAATPPVGTHKIGYGEEVTASVPTGPAVGGANNATRSTVTGWTGTGSVPAEGTGNSVTFTQTNDSSIVWNWGLPEQKLYFGGTLSWTDATTEKYEGCIENWIPNGDLSRSEAWTDDVLLAANRLRILAGGTYVIERDVTLAGIDFSAKDEPVVFDATDKSLNLTDTVNFHTKSVVTMKGGAYEMNGNSFMPENSYVNNRRKDMKIVLDGSVVTNSGRFVLGYYSGTGNNTLVLTNSAVYHQKDMGTEDKNAFRLCYAGAGGNLLHITTGSRLVLPAGINFHAPDGNSPQAAANAAGSTVIVEGEGSELRIGSNMSLADGVGNRLIVRDGAKFSSGWWYMGKATSRDGEVLFENVTDCSLGSPQCDGSNNVIRLRNATVSCGVMCRDHAPAAQNNGFDIINSHLVIQSIQHQNKYDGFGTCVRFEGTNTVMTVTGSDGMNMKHGGRFVFNLPIEGYAHGENGDPIIPLTCAKWSQFDATSSFEVEDVSAIKADMQARNRGHRSWRIARIDNADGLGSAIETSNKLAAEGVSFTVVSGIVTAHVRIPMGSMVIIR